MYFKGRNKQVCWFTWNVPTEVTVKAATYLAASHAPLSNTVMHIHTTHTHSCMYSM